MELRNRQIKTIPSGKDDGYNKVFLTLQPYEAYWLVFNPEGKKQVETKNRETAAREITLDGKWMLSYPGKDTVYKSTAKAQFSADKTINEERMKPGFDDSEWKQNTFILSQKTLSGNPKYLEETIKKEECCQSDLWRVTIPVGSKSMVFSPNMIGTDVWIDGKRINLTGSSIDLPADARLLSFARLIESEKLPVYPLKFSVASKANCALQSW
jgi:hypothetical protein